MAMNKYNLALFCTLRKLLKRQPIYILQQSLINSGRLVLTTMVAMMLMVDTQQKNCGKAFVRLNSKGTLIPTLYYYLPITYLSMTNLLNQWFLM
jgi:hypothetical protein